MEIKSLPPGSCWPSTLSASLDQSLRKRRVIEARQLALDTSKVTQERYRTALVADIEDELFQRKVCCVNEDLPPHLTFCKARGALSRSRFQLLQVVPPTPNCDPPLTLPSSPHITLPYPEKT